jgi:hypothetical protein
MGTLPVLGRIPWTGRRGPLVAEAVALDVLVALDSVLAIRAGPVRGELTTVVLEFAPGVGPVVALLAVLRRRFPGHIAVLATAVSGLSLLGTVITATRYAVTCGDQPTRSAAWYERLSDRQGPRYPLFGWAYGLGETCGYWSDKPRQELPEVPPEAAANILVVQGEFDPQNRLRASKSGRTRCGRPLVSVDDSPFHGQYALSGNPCVDGLVNVFLTKNSRPATTTCPGVPLPGEDELHPVAGPVPNPASSAQTRLSDGEGVLRTRVQDEVSALNRDW